MKSEIKYIYLFIFSILITHSGRAQYITLPDPLFADFIASTYPSAVNVSNQLDTNVAKTITGNFVCKSKNITNVTGLEYFQSLVRIEIINNSITTIPDLTKTTGLDYLALDSNQVTSLPPLNGLNNLTRLYCRHNPLTSFPSLAGMSNLVNFFCNGNQLSSAPDLTGCTSLDHLILSDNHISSLPDLSTLSSLRRFLASNNEISIADLSMVPSLEEVHLRYNNLTDFPNITGLSLLHELWLDGNEIKVIPDLSSFSALNNFRVQWNNLTFEDLLSLTSHPNFSSFQVSPQNNVAQKDSLQRKVSDSLDLIATVDTSLSGNTYTWYKDGTVILSNSSGILHFDSLTLNDNGSYYYEIRHSHPSLSTVILTSYPIKLSVLSCFDASQLSVNIQNQECKSQPVISIDESSIYGGIAPYTFLVTNRSSGEITSSDSSSFSVPTEGNYDIVIEDQLGCKVELKNKLSIVRSLDCEPIFYPDLNGPGSGYFIETSGIARIYNKGGKLIRELQTPSIWDGRNIAGELLESGVYIIIINEQVRIQVSLMRVN